MVSGERRPLPILPADTIFVGPRVARMLAGVWATYVEPGLRTNAVRELPAELADFVEALRVVAGQDPGGVPAGSAGSSIEAEDATMPLVTTTEAGALLACSARHVRGLRSRGRLLGRRLDSRRGWLYARADVEAMAAERREAPTPRSE